MTPLKVSLEGGHKVVKTDKSDGQSRLIVVGFLGSPFPLRPPPKNVEKGSADSTVTSFLCSLHMSYAR